MGNGLRKQKVILGAIILLQVLMMLFVGYQKQEFHIDEIYSYTFSNSYDADLISNADWMWDNWISGDSFDEFVTVQKGEEFSYATVYKNNSLDCHPPLFYWCIHTVCSLAPDYFSKWFGLGLNIVFFVFAAVFIYMISDVLTQSPTCKLLPVIMWGFSQFAVDTCTFIRMYMLLTVFALGFIYLHIRMFKNGVSPARLFLIWILIYLGSMTHYYSVVLSFWGVLFFCIFLLLNKKIKTMFQYGIGSCISIVALLISYPYVLTQATGSSTNDVGNEIVRNLFNIKLWIKMTISLANQGGIKISYNRLISYILLLIIVLAFVVLLIRNKKGKTIGRMSDWKEIIWLAATIIMTFLSISFIGGEYVRLRYIYHIIPIAYIIAVVVFERLLQNNLLLSKFVVVICITFSVLNAMYGTANGYSSYLFKESANVDKTLGKYRDMPLIVTVDKIGAVIPTGNFTKFKMFNSIYMAEEQNILDNNLFKETLDEQGECMVYIPTETNWTDGIDPDELLGEALKNCNADYTYVADGSYGKYYYIFSQ